MLSCLDDDSVHLKGQGMLMRMLVALSLVYILCTAPDVVLALTRFTIPEFRADGDYCRVFVIAHRVRHAIVMVNSSSNFFVYIKMSSRYRQELKLLCNQRLFRRLRWVSSLENNTRTSVSQVASRFSYLIHLNDLLLAFVELFWNMQCRMRLTLLHIN